MSTSPCWAAKDCLPPAPVLESSRERAARLWQAGVFALQKGDYAWARHEFEACLKADPSSEECKKGAADAADQAAQQPEKPAKRTAKAKRTKRPKRKKVSEEDS